LDISQLQNINSQKKSLPLKKVVIFYNKNILHICLKR